MKLGDLIWAECLRVILKHNLKISFLTWKMLQYYQPRFPDHLPQTYNSHIQTLEVLI